jgi:hypothetical protein
LALFLGELAESDRRPPTTPSATATKSMMRLRSALSRGAPILAGAALAGLSTHALAEPMPSKSVDAAAHKMTLDTLVGRVVALEKALFGEQPAPQLVVVSPTFYPNLDDVRLKLGLDACRRAKALGVPLLLVDASPPEVRAALQEAGATVHVQTAKGRKGAALRECIGLAQTMLPADGVICFQELEKVEMIGLQREVAAHIRRTGCDVCVPRRADSAFHRSYPIEQYHQVRTSLRNTRSARSHRHVHTSVRAPRCSGELCKPLPEHAWRRCGTARPHRLDLWTSRFSCECRHALAAV